MVVRFGCRSLYIEDKGIRDSIQAVNAFDNGAELKPENKRRSGDCAISLARAMDCHEDLSVDTRAPVTLRYCLRSKLAR